ncbi:11381_t:CDS:2, partial [Acaulospora morrowiae]
MHDPKMESYMQYTVDVLSQGSCALFVSPHEVIVKVSLSARILTSIFNFKQAKDNNGMQNKDKHSGKLRNTPNACGHTVFSLEIEH